VTIVAEHDALAVFLGDWWAEGTTYSGDPDSPDNPHGERSPWRSVHNAQWHSGGFFLVQDERANGPFDTLSVLGWDPDGERYFARSFENHGYLRDYTLTLDGALWTFTGAHERAGYEFSDDGRTQTIAWQRRVDDTWLPLCDRVATRVD
jgi:Protein of unknown function (DUF1579)